MRKIILLIILTLVWGISNNSYASLLYSIDYFSNALYSVSTTDASVVLIGSTGITDPYGYGFGSLETYSDGKLYGFTVGGLGYDNSNPTLYSINPNTASATAIGTLFDAEHFVFEGGLAFSNTGTAYGTNEGADATSSLFNVNLTTGEATIIGTISGGTHDINGLAWRSDGMLVGLDRVTSSLLAINPTTASSSVIASLGWSVGDMGGMAVSGSTGYFIDDTTRSLYSFDLFNGSYDLIGSYGPYRLSGLAASVTSAPDPVPEPTTMLLLGTGLVGVAGAARRKKKKIQA